jgi:SAM-dependent methyltransferase
MEKGKATRMTTTTTTPTNTTKTTRQERRFIAELQYYADYTKYWIETDWRPHCPKCIYKKQEQGLINVLELEIDLSKVESVLEIGSGYGRIAKVLAPLLPNLKEYTGLDISEKMIGFAREYLKGTYAFLVGKDINTVCWGLCEDFEHWQSDEHYDLVISVDTMTVLPPNHNVRMWIGKMVNLSKKYVINLDWYRRDGHNIRKTSEMTYINNQHDYNSYYETNRNVFSYRMFPIPNFENETLFVARVK